MRGRPLIRVIGWLVAALALTQPARAADVLLFSAASLVDALGAVTRAYTQRTGADIAAVYDSSGALARQIESGAPASVFVSANPDWIAYLVRNGLIEKGGGVELCRNRLVLIAPRESSAPLSLSEPKKLIARLADGPLAIGDPDNVPAGQYAKAALEHLGLWQKVARRTARARNVREALAYVERGAAPLGIVYATDARASRLVRVLDTFPEDSHPPIVYRAALLDPGRKNASAKAFFAYLTSRAAAAVLARYGFQVPAG